MSAEVENAPRRRLAPTEQALILLGAGNKSDEAAAHFREAIRIDPSKPDAHYRLGTDYVHLGQKEEAQKEFAIYQKLRAEHLAEVDKERAEVQQFVYSAKAPEAAASKQ